MSNEETNGIVPNAKRLLWAGFLAILAAGVGFAIRGGIFADWSAEFGFTAGQLGDIGGAGFTGFCFGIMIGGVIVDKIGYGKLVAAAFVFHVLSAIVTFMAVGSMGTEKAFAFLKWGMFIFAVANGTLEAVANPLVATLFPKQRTHYLNILHASWPAGLVIGGLATAALGNFGVNWKVQLSLYLIPTVGYGLMFIGQSFPKSEASAKGLSIAEMFKDIGILGSLVMCFVLYLFFNSNIVGPLLHNPENPESILPMIVSGFLALGVLVLIGKLTNFAIGHWLIFVLFLTHALVGAVELGTDQWAQNITGNILTPGQGKILFVWTSAVMFALRFCAHFIESKLKLSPIGILLTCAMIACLGLNLTAGITAFGGAMAALSVYALGKTFFWPTMLAVVGDRFPRSGAIAMSIMGGIGMMSAGLIGSPGLGYFKDRYASEELDKANSGLYQTFKSESESKFLIFEGAHGLDGKLVGALKEPDKASPESLAKVKELSAADKSTVLESDIAADRRVLKTDSLIPATMAVIYLLLFMYFKSIGGYKPVSIDTERITGGVEGPMEA